MNIKGIIDTNGTTMTYLLPGLASAIVSAVVQAANPFDVSYTDAAGTQTVNPVNRSG